MSKKNVLIAGRDTSFKIKMIPITPTPAAQTPAPAPAPAPCELMWQDKTGPDNWSMTGQGTWQPDGSLYVWNGDAVAKLVPVGWGDSSLYHYAVKLKSNEGTVVWGESAYNWQGDEETFRKSYPVFTGLLDFGLYVSHDDWSSSEGATIIQILVMELPKPTMDAG